jgi:hypothetical protein
MRSSLAIAAGAAAAAFAAAACSPGPGPAPKTGLVSATEVSAFYERNPVLFSGRKVYEWRQITTEAAPERFESLAQPASMEQVEEFLGAEGIAFRADRSTRPAEDVPLALLPRLAAMKAGEIAILASRRGVLVVQLVEAKDAPVSQREAAPLIERFLAGRKREQLARLEHRT